MLTKIFLTAVINMTAYDEVKNIELWNKIVDIKIISPCFDLKLIDLGILVLSLHITTVFMPPL
jgi:hypothetical protein